jgi:hypothetical protein
LKIIVQVKLQVHLLVAELQFCHFSTFTLEWRLCTLIRFPVADGFDVNLASVFVVLNSLKIGFSVVDGFLRVVQVASLLRRKFLCCVSRAASLSSRSYLELGDQLVLGLFLGLDLVDVVVAGGGPGSVHRRTTRVAPRQRGGVVWWFLKMIWTDYQETARGNELLLRDVGEDSFCDASFS